MIAFPRRLLLTSLGALALAGCSDGRPRTGPPSATAPDAMPAIDLGPPPVEVAPAARDELVRVGREACPGERPRVRLEVVAGGCSGMYHRLSLDPTPPAPGDVVVPCGEVDCVFARAQAPLVQGVVIDWVAAPERGFKVTRPNPTQENREKTRAWVTAEFDKQLRDIRADIDARVAEFRRAAAEDPDNELPHLRLGQLLLDDGRYEDAAASFERVLALAPRTVKAYQSLGQCLLALGRRDRAVEVLRMGKAAAEKAGDTEVGAAIAGLLAEAAAPPDAKK